MMKNVHQAVDRQLELTFFNESGPLLLQFSDSVIQSLNVPTSQLGKQNC